MADDDTTDDLIQQHLQTPLELAYPSQEAVPEPFRPFYEERDGRWQWRAQFKGSEGKAIDLPRVPGLLSTLGKQTRRINELEQRERELQELRGQLGDVPVEEYLNTYKRRSEFNESALRELSEEQKKEALKAQADKIDNEWRPKLTAAERRAEEAERRAVAAEEKLNRTRVESDVGAALDRIGVKPRLRPMLIREALGLFQYDPELDATVVRPDASDRHDPRGNEYTPETWATEYTAADRETFLVPNQGGGGPNGAGGTGLTSADNPFVRNDRTAISRLVAENPTKAAQYARAAKVPESKITWPH